MLNLYRISTRGSHKQDSLTAGEELAVYYHNLFDFPLNLRDLIKWKAADSIAFGQRQVIIEKSGYFYPEGREGLIYKRLLRKRISQKKLVLAKKAARIISLIPTVKMIGVTGSLAMENASDDSDIDLLIVTKKGLLWTTRLAAYCLLKVLNINVRAPGSSPEKDKLCLNMWLDEGNLAWKKRDRSLYTAHEIAQVLPLINKDKTYESFLHNNKWILDFWPNAIKVTGYKDIKILSNKKKNHPVERLAYLLQKNYMKRKITREIITPTRALFHPQDWGKVVIGRLSGL